MKLTEICIRRPVLSTVMSLIIVLVGIVAYLNLQWRQYPNVDEPRISVFTQMEGAGPEIIETQITKVLENVFAGLEGLELMTSRSEIGESRITLVFNLNRPIEAAANDVRDKIGRIRNKLPSDITEPRIRKADADAVPFIYLALYSDRHEVKDIADYAYRFLESRLEAVPGVSNVDIFGGGEYEMLLLLDPVKLAGYKLTSEDVVSALKKQNLEKPAGNIVTKDKEIIITTRASLSSEKEFENIIVTEKDGYLVRLKDLGHAELAAIERNNRVLFNGQNAVAIGVTRQSTANFLDIARDIKKQIPTYRLPLGMKIEVANDTTIYLERSLEEVYDTLFAAVILVILVIFLFLWSFRGILIPFVTIPISLVGALAIMYALGYTINILTLLALVLAIGLVVDDAIVMLENIYRHIEEGMAPLAAAFKGAREISFAVFAMTITLSAVYAPIALSPGLTGKLFKEFALTLAGSVILSGFVALTLTPMMCGRLLKPHTTHKTSRRKEKKAPIHGWMFWKELSLWMSKLDDMRASLLDDLDKSYAWLLRLVLTYRIWVLVGGGAISVLGGFLVYQSPSELIPQEDQGVINARGVPPFGSNVEFTTRYMRQVDAEMAKVPEVVKRLALINAPGESTSLNLLLPWEKRKRSSFDISKSLKNSLADITGLSVTPQVGGQSLLGGSSQWPIKVVLTSSKSYKELMKLADQMMKILGSIPGLYELWADYGNEGQEYVVTVDRDKAAALGVEVSSVGETLERLISESSASKFKRENKQYQVKVKLATQFRNSPEEILRLYVRGVTKKGRQEGLVPLSEIVTIEKRLAPVEISHFMGFRAVTMNAKLEEGYSMGTVLGQILEEGRRILPEGSDLDFTGESKRYLTERTNVYMIFALATLFIFLVLAAQYESWRDPWIIIVSVPLSLAGGAFLLYITHQTMNLYSQIGFVTLIGLITKHGILIVDFANKLKADGLSRVEAVMEAARLRLRPILMTTFAMVVGAVPLALAGGAGMESRRPIGLVIVGGMTLGTLFTLFVVPAVYTFLSRKDAAMDIQGLNDL